MVRRVMPINVLFVQNCSLARADFENKDEDNLCPNPYLERSDHDHRQFSYNPENDTYSGDITTLTATARQFSLRPNKKSGERKPDYHARSLCDHRVSAKTRSRSPKARSRC